MKLTDIKCSFDFFNYVEKGDYKKAWYASVRKWKLLKKDPEGKTHKFTKSSNCGFCVAADHCNQCPVRKFCGAKNQSSRTPDEVLEYLNDDKERIFNLKEGL